MNRAASHYDAVTHAWMKWVMGDDLHFGLFEPGRNDLAEATQNLTDYMVDKCQLSDGLSVLDVGCGIGTQSMHLAERHGCRVTGISTSAVGVELATERARERGLDDRVTFLLRDATDNALPDASFDRVFSLESAHLMPDKHALFSECFRVLRPNGRIALCDVSLVGATSSDNGQLAGYVSLGHSPAVAGRVRDAVHNLMHKAFGSTRLTHSSLYVEAADAAGFDDVALEDLSSRTRATLMCWGQNAHEHFDAIEEALGEAYLDDLFLALLHMSYGWGSLGGYIGLTASKT